MPKPKIAEEALKAWEGSRTPRDADRVLNIIMFQGLKLAEVVPDEHLRHEIQVDAQGAYNLARAFF